MKRWIAVALIVFAAPVQAAEWKKAKVSYHSPYNGFTLAARGVRIGTTIKFKAGNKTATGRVVDANGYGMRHRGLKFDLSDELFAHLFGGTKQGIGHLKYRIVRQGKGRLIPQ